jgi:hypothetical protein
MEHHGLDLQGAFDRAGDMCREVIDSFKENKNKLPSWGAEIDGDVARYVRGLEDWMSGSVQWSFVTERYFGRRAAEVKKTRVVQLARRRVPENAA